MTSLSSSSGRNVCTLQLHAFSLPTLIPGDLLHQLKLRLFLSEAIDLLYRLPQKALSVPPLVRRICSPELRNGATLFLHFRSTRCVPAADSWTNLFPVTLLTSCHFPLIFGAAKTTILSSTRSNVRRRTFGRTSSPFQEAPLHPAATFGFAEPSTPLRST